MLSLTVGTGQWNKRRVFESKLQIKNLFNGFQGSTHMNAQNILFSVSGILAKFHMSSIPFHVDDKSLKPKSWQSQYNPFKMMTAFLGGRYFRGKLNRYTRGHVRLEYLLQLLFD